MYQLSKSNVHIHTFRKRCSLIWGWFFPVSNLKIMDSLRQKYEAQHLEATIRRCSSE